MRKLLFASAALLVATPAVARDGSGYVELDGGLLFPQHMNGVFTSTFTQTAQTPAPGAPSNPLVAGNVVGTLPATYTTLPVAVTGGSEARLSCGASSVNACWGRRLPARHETRRQTHSPDQDHFCS